jgi:small conductance mechanosensitive channel
VRDVITGLFMLIENQIRVGDVAEINGTGGLVEEVNLRTTVLRSLDGTVHVIPNGTVGMLSNKTRGFSFYVLDVGIAYKEDTDRVVEVLKEIGDDMLADEEYKGDMLDRVEIFGVDKFADSAVIIKGRIKTQPIQQWRIGREFNRRLKKRFDELGIEIPFPHRSLYFGEASRPMNLSIDLSTREEIKNVVREVMAEELPVQTGSMREPNDETPGRD